VAQSRERRVERMREGGMEELQRIVNGYWQKGEHSRKLLSITKLLPPSPALAIHS
jgi:hypothetical protein